MMLVILRFKLIHYCDFFIRYFPVLTPVVSQIIGSDSSCELASVTRILDATNPTNFSAFFVPSDDQSSEERSQSCASSVVMETDTHYKVNTDMPKVNI